MTLSKVDEAQLLVSTLIQIQSTKRKIDVSRGKILWQLKSNSLYKQAFGEGIDTWEEFLRSPEIGLSISEANRAMQLYEYFILKFQLDESELEKVPVKSLHYLLPKLKSGTLTNETLPDLIDSARELTFFEFKERLQDVEVGEARTYTYLVMRKCNETKNLSKVVEISNEDVLSVWPQLNDY